MSRRRDWALLAAALCALATGCAGAALEAARRDIALAEDKRDLAMTVSPSRDQELGIKANLKRAEDAFDAARYEEASDFARTSSDLSIEAYTATLAAAEAGRVASATGRQEALDQAATIRSELEKVRAENDASLDLEGLFRQVTLRMQAAEKAFVAEDYEKAVASTREALLILEKRQLLFSLDVRRTVAAGSGKT